MVLPATAFSSAKTTSAAERALAFLNTHTGERLKTTYFAEGRYLPGSLRKIDFILRDARNNLVHEIDPNLLDLLFALATSLNAREPFHIISGYRSAATNEFLRRRSAGVAEKSLHLVGRAVDIRLPGPPLSALRDAAFALQGGGVGYYPKSDFVHIDIGRVRCW